MRIVYLQRYRSGYRGFAEEPEHWVLFQYTRRGGLRRLAAYSRTDFQDYAHFTGVMGRFMPDDRFLKVPVEIKKVDMEEFNQLWRRLAASRKPF